MFKYIINGTNTRNLESIFKDGYIEDNNGIVCTQFISDKINYIGPFFRWYLWGRCVICIDIDILTTPFSCTEGISAGNGHLIIQRKNYYKKLPKLNKLITYINNRMLLKRNKYKKSDSYIYSQSHEILFNGISINYIKKIIIHKSEINDLSENIRNIISSFNIELVILDNLNKSDWQSVFNN